MRRPSFVEEGCDLWCPGDRFGGGTLLLFDPGAASASQGGTSMSLSGGWTPRLTQLMTGYWCWLASMALFLSGSVLKLCSRVADRQNRAAAGSGVDADVVSVPTDGQKD